MPSAPVRRIDPVQLARRQLARSGVGHKPPHWLIAWPLSLLFTAIGLWLLCSFLPVLAQWRHSAAMQLYALATAAGMAFFAVCHCAPAYVFGHEMTHFLAAKAMRHRTGKVVLSWRHGYVEVPNPNAAIVLAPYVIPFYFVISAGLLALAAGLWPDGGAPEWYAMGSAAWLGVCTAFHLVLTAIAVIRTQSDLAFCGRALSLSIILCGNLAFFRIAAWVAQALLPPPL